MIYMQLMQSIIYVGYLIIFIVFSHSCHFFSNLEISNDPQLEFLLTPLIPPAPPSTPPALPRDEATLASPDSR